jgi:hypothetical protein
MGGRCGALCWLYNAGAAWGLVDNMWRKWVFSLAVLGLTATITSTAFAQDKLATIVVKQKIAKDDRAQIDAEVPDRVKKLEDATNEKDRARACEKLLATAKIQGATKAGLDAYAEACAGLLEPLMTKDPFETAFSALHVAIELDNRNTTPALAAALKSRYAAVRYRAARGIEALHAKLKGDQELSKTALQALGEAGAAEQDRLVLNAIYQAIDFYTEVPDFQLGDDCARALNLVFAARARLLSSGSYDELLDEPGFAAAAACYATAAPEEQVKLAKCMSQFLSHAVDRYFAPDTGEEYLPTLAALIKKIEDPLRTMIKASNKDVPGTTVAGEISGKGAVKKKQPAAQAALQELLAVLKGEPWNIS